MEARPDILVYDKKVLMEPGRTYKVTLGPMTTSNYFEAGHRIRIEISSSYFPLQQSTSAVSRVE